MRDVEGWLGSPELAATLDRLGLRAVDRDAAVAAAGQVREAGDASRIARLAERLQPVIGAIDVWSAPDPWDSPDAGPEPYGAGVAPLLALAATATDVVAWHGRRGIPAELSWAALADLGHQVWVHRETFGTFGLHTEGWLRLVWSGVFLWLGRLQFNLQRDPVDDAYGWVLSTHIPPTGPLRPALVEESFAQAAQLFPRYFPEYPAGRFYCGSWLLDPELVAALPPESNMSRFGRRWTLYGEPRAGNEDALFFTFRRRGHVALDTLPTDTTLQRVIIDRIRGGEHWQVWHGHHPFPHAKGTTHD